jgi:membrane associated rhomboid family serine protease
MFKSIWEDIKREFSYGNMVSRLVIINVMVFLAINLVWVILQIANGYITPPLYHDILSFFAIPSDWLQLLIHPWSVITSMFLHEGFFHLLFNMLMLYWFGRILGDFLGDHRVLPLYLMAGLSGNIVYFISANLAGYATGGGIAFGASGAVMGVVIATAVLSPDFEMRLLLFGNVKIKYIAAVLLLIDIIGIGGMSNTGGHYAHLGGALFGWFFIYKLQRGDDWSAPVNKVIGVIHSFFLRLGQQRDGAQRKGPRMGYRNPNAPTGNRTTGSRDTTTTNTRRRDGNTGSSANGLSHEERVDAILEKIKQSGYENLTEDEKKFLFNASKK